MTKKYSFLPSSARILFTQIVTFVCTCAIPPIVIYLYTSDSGNLWKSYLDSLLSFLPCVLLYCFNFYFLIPKFLYKNKKWSFVVLNLVISFACVLVYYLKDFKPNEHIDMQTGKVILTYALSFSLIMICIISMAIGHYYLIAWNRERRKMKEQELRNREAELNWLKYQLNPHFLFNTLNNISSLISISPDSAQDNIAKLSDTLRYALYESNSEKVKLCDDAEFIKDYIDLMAMRVGGKAKIDVQIDDFDSNIMISPLLFITLAENAFKHSSSNRNDSYISIWMKLEDGYVVFSSENTIAPKKANDMSTSGIGLENLKRRLEILYPEAHSYESGIDKRHLSSGETTDIYWATLKIKI